MVTLDLRLTRALDLITGTLNRLDRPADEVTDDDITASRTDLSKVLPMVVDLLGEQVNRPGRSSDEVERHQELRDRFAAHRDSRALGDEVPEDPQLRARLVRYLRTVAVTVATALVGIVLQAAFDAIGASDAVGQATVHGAEAVQRIASQLKAGLPGLVTPALVGGQFAASIVLLNEADELLDALSPFRWTARTCAAQGAASAGQATDVQEGIKNPELREKALGLAGKPWVEAPSGSSSSRPKRGSGRAPGAR